MTVQSIQNQASGRSSVLNITNSIVGAGLLAFPSCFKAQGILGATLTIVIFGSIATYTAYVVGKYTHLTRQSSYQGLATTLLGKGVAIFVAIILVIYKMGVGAAYFIVVGDAMTPLFLEHIAPSIKGTLPFAVSHARQVVISVLGICIVYPVTLQRAVRHYSFVAYLALAALGWLVLSFVFVGIKGLINHDVRGWGLGPHADKVQWLNLGPAYWQALPRLAFGFHSHAQFIPIVYELSPFAGFNPFIRKHTPPPQPPPPIDQSTHFLEHPPYSQMTHQKLAGIRSLAKWALSIPAVVYLLTGLFGYGLYGDSVEPDVTKNLPNTGYYDCIRALVAFSVLFHYPINLHVSRAALDDLFRVAQGQDMAVEVPYWRLVLSGTIVFVVAISVALVVDDLGEVYHVLGAIAASLLICILPGAIMFVTARASLKKAGTTSRDSSAPPDVGELELTVSNELADTHVWGNNNDHAPLVSGQVSDALAVDAGRVGSIAQQGEGKDSIGNAKKQMVIGCSLMVLGTLIFAISFLPLIE